MEMEKIKQIIESILFAVGRDVSVQELSSVLEMTPENVQTIVESMKIDFEEANNLGLQTEWALALPGKVAPKTSAMYIYEIIKKIKF